MPPPYRSWREQLPGTFAGSNAPFGSHPKDEERAVKMFHAALREGASIEDIQSEARNFLIGQGIGADEVERQCQRILDFSPQPTARLRMSKAWLVTWEYADRAPDVVSVFKSSRSPEHIKDYIEQHYIDGFYSPQEKLLYAYSRANNPFPAAYATLDGVPWQGRITCGQSPHLYGRLVANLRASGPGVLRPALVQHPVNSFHNNEG